MLRWYQKDAIAECLEFLCKKDSGNPLIVCPTGAGKSHILAGLSKEICSRWGKQNIVILAHRKELLEQNAEKFIQSWPGCDLGIYSAGLKSREIKQITVAGIQSAFRNCKDFGWQSLVIVDECFVENTKISTLRGNLRIDLVRPGDLVYNAFGVGMVKAVSSRKESKFLKIKLSNGKTIQCTENHPFFTNNGWQKAKKLGIGEILFSKEDLYMLFKRIPALEQPKSKDEGKGLAKAKMLLTKLCEEVEESDAQSTIYFKNEKKIKRDSTQTYSAMRERFFTTHSSFGTASRIRGGLVSGISGQDGSRIFKWYLSQLLQSRYRKQKFKNCNRNRRRESLFFVKKKSRFKKNKIINIVRVESIEVVKPKGARTVYNLHVSGHPSYFANGILVHNCHLIPKSGEGMYRTFLEGLKQVNPKLKVVGLTATPFRLDSGLLCDGEDAIFSDICYDIPLKKLIDDGYLSKLRSKESKIQADLSDARTRGGEFVNEDIIKIMDEDSLTDAALNEILKLGADRKSWLLFCTGVRHAEKVCKKLEDRGIKSACITGETDSNLRAWTLSEFKKGNIQAITNCDVLTTGFDAPNIDLLILLRPTKSAGLYIQMVGRGSRLAPNKKDCLILDFAGNIDRFGPLDAIKIKHKNGKAIVGKEPTKTCPSCEELVPIGMTRCAVCGFEFQSERMIKHDVKASSAPLFSEEREFQVQGFDANIHSKPGKPDSVRLNFYCIGLTVSHFLCFQHQGFAKKVAIRWWKENCVQHGAPAILENLDHAIDSIKKLPRPKKIICIKDGKFWRLNKVEWDENRSNYLEAANEILDEIGINI